ncbi:hypothetical protein [Massilia sp. TS11]|uniref:hypothetical protein n=1 Tax=Massilia sp. TS11 TaxID=2908003 RepID=UPI001ED9ED9B|nr:hypothetical protein [Massilia sp. TS11]MCG2583591.1 hypothetical protein [Massilia sp. TS11]
MQNRSLLRLSPLSLALVLAACGGGSSSNTAPTPAPAPVPAPAPTPTPAVTSVTVSGTAATGAPLANASVQLKCRANTIPATTSGSTGSFSLAVPSDSFPCVGRASAGSVTLHAVLEGASGNTARMNITPFTEMMVAQMAGSTRTPAQFFEAIGVSAAGAPAFSAINASAVAAAFAGLKNIVPDSVRSALNELGSETPLNVNFLANGSGHDAALDSFNQALAAAKLTLAQASASLAANPGGSVALLPLVQVQTLSAQAGASISIAISGKALPANSDVTVRFGSITTALGKTNASGTSVTVTLPSSLGVTGLPLAVAVDGAYGSALLTVLAPPTPVPPAGESRKPLLVRTPTGFADLNYKATAADVAELDGKKFDGTLGDGSACSVGFNRGTMTLTARGASYSASFNGDSNDSIESNMGNGSPYLSLTAVDGGTKTVFATLGAASIASATGVPVGDVCRLSKGAALPADFTTLSLSDRSWAANKARIVSATPYTGKGKRTGGSGTESCSVTISETAVKIQVGSAPEVSVPLEVLADGSVGGVNYGTSGAWLPWYVAPLVAVKAPAIEFTSYARHSTADEAAGNGAYAEIRAFYAGDGSNQITGLGQVFVRKQKTAGGTYEDNYACVIRQSKNGVDW